jgi:hypothetical protein
VVLVVRGGGGGTTAASGGGLAPAVVMTPYDQSYDLEWSISHCRL